MNILFVASVALVSPDPREGRRLLMDTIGLPLKRHEGDEYYFSESIAGSKHFGIWPLSQAARACFGTTTWPSDRPIPQACFEFEVADEGSVASAAEELQSQGLYVAAHRTYGTLGTDHCKGTDGRGRDRRDLIHALDA